MPNIRLGAVGRGIGTSLSLATALVRAVVVVVVVVVVVGCASCLVEKASTSRECSWCTKGDGSSFCFNGADKSTMCASPGDGYHSHSCPITCPSAPGKYHSATVPQFGLHSGP
jgi:hypothetical protein